MVRENPFCTRIAEAGEQKIRQLEKATAGRRCRKQTGFDTFRVQAASLLPVMQVCAHQARRPRTEWRTEIESASAAGADTARLQGPSSSMPATGWRTGCRPSGSCATACPWAVSLNPCRYLTRAPGSGGTGCLPPWDGYQDRIVLKKRIWIDETYIVDTDLTHGYDQARKRGLSSQQLCIAVGIDVFKNPYAVVCGHGKPSTRRIRNFAAT
jgi:hypothetical protein